MRIKKPKQNDKYILYPTIDKRNQDQKNLVNGQEVKVLDASADPAIESGWAIYKFDKTNDVFDLLEKEHESVYEPEYYEFPNLSEAMRLKDTIKSGATIKVLDASGDPKVKQGFAFYLIDGEKSGYSGMKLISKEGEIAPDEITIFNTGNEKLSVPDAMIANRTDVRILEDFDFSLSYDGTDMILEPIGGTRTIPIMCGNAKKYLTICPYKLSFKIFDNQGKGKRVNWTIEANISDTDQTNTAQVFGFVDSGETVIVKPKSSDVQLTIMQVSVLVPYSGTPLSKEFFIHKYWKKALAPAEERMVIPESEAVIIDNYTIEKNGDTLTVPAALNPIRHNYTIKKNFQLDLNFDDRNFIRVTPRGADENGFLQIPIEIATNGFIYTLQLGTVDLPVSAFTGDPEFIHFGIIAKVEGDQAPKIPCEYIFEADGSPLKLRPTQVDQQICIAQIRAKKPVNTDGWREEFVTVWKYWRNYVLEESTGGAPAVDGYGAEYVEIDGVTKMTSIGAMTSNYYSLRYLQDFDFDFKVIYDKVNNLLTTVAIPIGGNRTIKATRSSGDTDGNFSAKETFYLSLKTIDNTMNNPEKGKFLYFHFGSDMPKIDTLQNMNVAISTTPDIKPNNNYKVTFGVLKIYIPKDGEAFDHGKVYLYKFWKNALATTEERSSVDWYGVTRNFASDSPTCERIGNMDLHKSLPVQSQIKRCLLWDNGTVHYYLDPNDSTKKADGTAAVLDGSHGQVMVEIPEYYYSYERIGTICNYKISLIPLEGFKRIKKTYVSAYESVMQRSSSKLSSLINLDPDFRGGLNKSSDDADALKTGLGRPVGNELRSTLRTAAYNRGDNWHMYHVYNHYMLSMLFVIEYSTFNSQLAFNSELDNSGYKQGGLGKGLTDGDSIGHMITGMSAVIPCGITNSLGNNSGEAFFTAIGFAMGTDQELTANSYRGIENPFGHMAKLVDGINSIASHAYVSEAKKGLSDDVIDGFEYVGRLVGGGYITDVFDHILPLPKTASGGGSTTYLCDHSSINNNSSSVSLGSMLSGLDGGGLFSISAKISTTPLTYAGTRLCFTHE